VKLNCNLNATKLIWVEVSVNTIHAQRNSVMAKLNLHKQADLVHYAIKAGIAKL
jgi:DNA-binding NarL/FixJ family response regulator